MKIKISKDVIRRKDVDIDFPIYRKYCHDHDDSIEYIKVENMEKEINIHIYDDGKKVELEISEPYFYVYDDKPEDYLLGKGIFASSEKEFNEAIEIMNKLIASI